MADVRGFLADHRIGVTVAAAALVVVGGVAVASGTDSGVTVSAVVDGVTVDVVVDGEDQRVRLMNVLTPGVDECQGDAAVEFLEGRLPAGTEITLEYDEERTDEGGHVLAGIVEAGSLVNADLAGAGLAVAVEPELRFYEDVLAAQQAAESDGTGLYSDSTECTLVAQVNAYTEQVEEVEGHVRRGTVAQIDGWAAEAAAVAVAGAALVELLDGDETTFPLVAYTGDRWTLHDDVTALNTRVAEAEEALAAERTAEEERVAAEERAEEERREQEQREREAAEQREREEAEQQEREEAERAAAEEAERQAAEDAARAEREAADREASEQAEQESQQSSGSSGGGGSAYYDNCTAARDAGAAPVYAGEAGYGRHLDRDGDGIGCE